MTKRQFFLIVCLLAPLYVVAQTHLPHPQPGVTSPSEIPGIDDPLWKDIASWPKQISKGKIKYTIQYSGKSVKYEGQKTSDINEIDKHQNYSAHYSPDFYDDDVKKDDHYYGPFFGWRSDGSLFLKEMTDEYGNHESHYLFPDGKYCQSSIYDKSLDLFMMSFYENGGTLIGYYIIQNEWTPDKPKKTEYWLNGKFVSEEELKKFRCGFALKCIDNKYEKCADEQDEIPNNIIIDASKVNRGLENINARISPHFSDGEVNGLRISNIDPSSVFNFMKLKNNDVILSFNDKAIKSVGDSFEFYNALESQTELTLRIKRDSAINEIHYKFK